LREGQLKRLKMDDRNSTLWSHSYKINLVLKSIN
jgi:hypothetical protein